MVSQMEDVILKLEAAYAKALDEAGENFRAAEKNTAGEGGVKYALRAFEDGTRFVDVKVDPNIFSGMTVAQINRTVKKMLMERFSGKVIGIDNRVFVNGDSVNEYLHPSKSIDAEIRKAKLTAAGELDNILDAGQQLPNRPDGEDGHVHPDVFDFSYFKTIFKVGNEYFEGIVNVKNINRGKLLKDVTKIKNITQDIVSSYGETPKSNFLRDASMIRVHQYSETVNKKFSLRDSQGNELSEGQQEYFKDSKIRNTDGSLKVMYHGSEYCLTDDEGGIYNTPVSFSRSSDTYRYDDSIYLFNRIIDTDQVASVEWEGRLREIKFNGKGWDDNTYNKHFIFYP